MRDNRHNLTHQLLGKHDWKGRLLSDVEREELHNARYMGYIAEQPDHPVWSYFIGKIDDQLVAIMGKDAFNAWLDEQASRYQNGCTSREMYVKAVKKLDEEKRKNVQPTH